MKWERTGPGYYRLFARHGSGYMSVKSTRNPLVILWWRLRYAPLESA
jgi:hypothetical protein